MILILSNGDYLDTEEIEMPTAPREEITNKITTSKEKEQIVDCIQEILGVATRRGCNIVVVIEHPITGEEQIAIARIEPETLHQESVSTAVIDTLNSWRISDSTVVKK